MTIANDKQVETALAKYTVLNLGAERTRRPDAVNVDWAASSNSELICPLRLDESDPQASL